MEKVRMRLLFSSGFSAMAAKNASFDSGILRVAYTGENRNGSYISKETFEKCIQSIYNCPIVCNYNRETDTIGSHDVEVVHYEDGSIRLVNVTQPVGVVPESANYYWEMIEDDSGTHEYLCVEVLIWKRQEAYRKIKADGITAESMEITVLDGGYEDGVYVIRDFEFTAFCLLGSAEPCFESAALEVFSDSGFQESFQRMMEDFKHSFSVVSHREGVEDTCIQSFRKGGAQILEEKICLLAEFGLTADDLDFAINDYEVNDLRAKLIELGYADDEGEGDGASGEETGGDDTGAAEESDVDGTGETGDPDQTPDQDDPVVEEIDDGDDDTVDANRNRFELSGQIREELCRELSVETIEMPWGEDCRYWLYDYDESKGEVYCHDITDWLIYGFAYSWNGDHVVVDFASKKRMKIALVDFDEGEQPVVSLFTHIVEKSNEHFEELAQLREFMRKTQEADAQAAANQILTEFADLDGDEAFEQLREHALDYSAADLEEKCFAIRGRRGTTAVFGLTGKPPKIQIKHDFGEGQEPYGGLFQQYGVADNN